MFSLIISPYSSTRVPSDQKHSVSANSDECLISAYFDESNHGPDYVQDEKSSGTKSPSQQDKCEAIASVVQNETQTSGLPNSFIGMSSSSSDPVHVPSLDSASAEKVGAIQREVGVVGFRRQTSDHPENRSSVSNSFLSSSLSGKNICFSVESTGHQAYTSKSHSLKQISPSAADLYSTSLSRQSQGCYQNSRLHQHSLSQQKGIISYHVRQNLAEVHVVFGCHMSPLIAYVLPLPLSCYVIYILCMKVYNSFL